ncbi:MAG: serine/threonine protein kinase [Candidatus Aureabacteria bacterium]|nr:serine/threonine protein kinase [Candidatus Auribacterota bacterium]
MKDKVIGGCRIIRKIGEGGMGIVYEAEQLSLGRKVALKLLSSQFVKERDYEERFIREARSAARINHSNVVQIYNTGKEDNNLYLVMEYVDGETLQKKILDNPLISPKEMALIMKSIAEALFQAEKRKIVHRDMKPSNIMVTSAGVLKVMDFGLAKAIDTHSTLTGTGKLLGTPYYMSPEQINGADVDSRSDIYSTGVILYFMLTKKKPFKGDLYTVIQQHLNTSRPDPKDLNPDTPDFLRRIYFKMTKVKPEDRFQSFKDVVKELDKNLLRISPNQKKKADTDLGTIITVLPQKKKEASAPEKSKEASSPSIKKMFYVLSGVFFVFIIAVILFALFSKKSPKVVSSVPAVEESNQVKDKQVKKIAKKGSVNLHGALLVKDDALNGKVFFKGKCTTCGNVQQKTRESLRPALFKKRLNVSKCDKCGKKDVIVIENLK